MAFKTFAAGAVLTASDLNTYLMNQSVITCTSATRPASPVEGMLIYETDTDIYQMYTGAAWTHVLAPGAWTTWTPTIQNFTIGNGTISAAYARIGFTVLWRLEINFGSTTSITGIPYITYPTYPAHDPAVAPPPIGWCRVIDASPSANYQGFVLGATGVLTPSVFAIVGARVSMEDINATTPITWTTNDKLLMSGFYEDA